MTFCDARRRLDIDMRYTTMKDSTLTTASDKTYQGISFSYSNKENVYM